MLFSKRKVTNEDRFEFSMVPLIDPVSYKVSTPNHVTVGTDKSIFLVSLSNQHISFTYEMPRYFALGIDGLFVFFFVINHTRTAETTSNSIFVKGIKIPKRIQKKTKTIYALIEESLVVYYEDYTIDTICMDPTNAVQYYTKMNDGKLFYH